MAVTLLSSGTAAAEILAETACYVGASRHNSGVPVHLAVRIYTDSDTRLEVGAFAQYNHEKSRIPLVFVEYVPTDTDSPSLGNYELTRIEVVNKKMAGEYRFVQTGAGFRQERYVTYRSATSPEPLLLQRSGGNNDRDCKFNWFASGTGSTVPLAKDPAN